MSTEDEKWARLRAALEAQPQEGLLEDLAYLRAVSEELRREQTEREQAKMWQRQVFGGVDFFDDEES